MNMHKITSAVMSAVFAAVTLGPAVPASAETVLGLGGSAIVEGAGEQKGAEADSILTLGAGSSKEMRRIKLDLTNNTGLSGDVEYSVNINGSKWTNWSKSGNFAGKSGKTSAVTAVRMRLTGDLADRYAISYQAQTAKGGLTQGWVCDGQAAGLEDDSYKVDLIKARIIERDGSESAPGISYLTKASKKSWTGKWKKNGTAAGASKKLISGLAISLTDSINGGITYRAKTAGGDWMSWVNDGEAVASKDKNGYLEAIELKLTGKIASRFNVYYRVKLEDLGWMGWAKNGEVAGASSMSCGIKAVQFVIEPKTGKEPSNVAGIKSAFEMPSLTKSNLKKVLTSGSYKGFVTIGGNTYHVAKGKLSNGVVKVDGKKYYFKKNTLVKNKTIHKGSKLYYIDSKGVIKRSIDGNKKMIALTYDDGPTIYTDTILDVLERNNSVASFFVIGSVAAGRKKYMTRASKLGCEVANHTYNHITLTKNSESSIKSQIASTDKLIQAATGMGSSIMRPPGGAVNKSSAAATGKPVIIWSVDTRDWEHHNKDRIVSSVLNGAKDGAIVLMHDRLSCTAEASKVIIPELCKRGYQLVTVSEMGLLRRGGLKKGGIYYSMAK